MRKSLLYRKNKTIRFLVIINLILFTFLGFSFIEPTASALELTKSVSNSNPLSGETFFYTLQYRCAGLTEDCLGTVITDPLPAGVEFVSVLGSVHTTAESYNAGTNTVNFTFIDPLISGTTGEVRIEVRYPNGTTPDGAIANNTATISASNAASVSSSVSTTASATARIDVDKSLLGGGAINGYSTYHLMICNVTSRVEENGTLNLNSITIVDTLPPGSIFVETNLNTGSSATYDAASHTVTITHPSLETGECIFPKVSVQYLEPTFSVGENVTNEAFWTVTPVGEGTQTLTASETFPLKIPNYLAETYKTLGNPTLFPGESSTYALEGVVSGTETVNQFCINDTIPSEIEITSFSLGGWFYGGLSGPSDIMNVSYTTNLNGPTLLSGSPRLMWTNDVIDVENDLGLTIGGGEYITALNFCFGDVPAGFEEFSPIELAFVVKSSTSPGVVTNCSKLSTTSPGFELRNECVDLTVAANAGIARLNPYKSIWPSGVHDRGDILVFQIAIRNELGAVDSVVNPIAYDLLPAGMEYVPGTWNLPGWGNTYGFPDPTFTFISDYEGTGREFLKWEWPAGLEIPPGERVVIAFNTEITDEAVGGFPAFYNYAYIQTPNATLCESGIQDADIYDFDNDGDVSELFCGDRIAVNINELLALESEKLVKGQFDNNYTKFPDVGNSVPGGIADYILEVRNPGNIPMDSVVVIDILPSVGDIGVIDVTNRDSRWQPNLVSSVSAPAGITVYYSTEANPCRADEGLVPSGPAGCVAPNWSATIPTDLTTVRSLKFDFGSTVLQPMDTIQLAWAMRVPVNIFSTIGAQPDSIAWNSFGYIGRRIDNGQYTLPSEPVKVGIDLNNIVPNVFGDFVWEDTNQNGIQDGGEPGINGVRVELFEDNGDGIPDPASDRFTNFTVTANGGYYLFPNLDDGDYYAVFYTPAAMDITTNDAGGNDAVDSDGVAQTYNGFDIAISPVVTLDNFAYDLSWDLGLYSSNTGAIGNYVWNDANGNGIQDESTSEGINGVTIYLYDNNSPTTPIDSVITSNDINGNPGYYLFSEVPSGNYFLELNLPSGVSYATQRPNGSSDLSDSDFNSSTNRTEVFTVTSGNYDNTWDAGLILSGVEICDNGIDDDGDTFADCADIDCPCPLEEICPILGPNLVINGEFDDGNVGFDSDYNYVTFPVFNTNGNYGNYSVILDNTLSNTYNIWKAVDRNVVDGNFLAADPSSSSGTNDDIWRQTVDVCPNTDFVFSAWAKNLYFLEAGIEPIPNFSFYINDVLLPSASFEVPQQSIADSMIWFQMNGLWNSGTATTAEMRIVNTNRGTTGNDLAIDGIYLAMCGSDIDIETNSTLVCPGEPVLLSATINTTESNWFFYEWLRDGVVVSSGTTASTFSASSSGSYTLQVYTTSDNSGCPNESNTIVIATNPQNGDVVIAPCAEICDDGIDNDLDGMTDCADCADCASSVTCDDNDNDGVGNLCDLDDDNDGIPDLDECLKVTIGTKLAFSAEDNYEGTPPGPGVPISYLTGVDGTSLYKDGWNNATKLNFTGWNRPGDLSVDWSQGQYILTSNERAHAETPAMVIPSPAGGGFAMFSTNEEAISQDITVEIGKEYTIELWLGILPNYYDNNKDTDGFPGIDLDAGQLFEYNGNIEIGTIAGGGVATGYVTSGTQIDPSGNPSSTYPYYSYNVLTDFPTNYSSADFPPSLPAYDPSEVYTVYPTLDPHWQKVEIKFVATATTATIQLKTDNGNWTAFTVDEMQIIEEIMDCDCDGDGIINSLDLDSDNDGLFDVHEAGHTAVDANNDGVIDGVNTLFGTNGLFDNLETSAESGILNYTIADSESTPDGVFDICELDSDGDGCFDVEEAGVADSENDGIAGTGTPTVDVNGLVISNTYILPPNNTWQNPLIGSCLTEICDDGIDNDGDGNADCLDSDCIPLVNSASLITCDNSNMTGSGVFILHDANPTVSTESGVVISYHPNLSDAQNGVNNLISPHTGSDGIVYARVERLSTGCFNTAPITLDVGEKCRESCVNGVDDDGDGLIDCEDPDCPCCN